MKYLPPVIEKMYREKSLDDLDFFAMTNCLDSVSYTHLTLPTNSRV